MTRLSVNVNKVATLRNARGENNPDVIKFALHCESHGAEGITVHPRPDERHIRRSDVYELSKVLGTEFNIEGYPSEEFLELVASVRPTQVTLVPDKPDQLTSNAGWDVVAHSEFLAGICRRMHQCGIRVSIFVDPDEAQIVAAKGVGADRVELYTKAYADGYRQDCEAAIAPYIAASAKAAEVGLGLNAGHDLSLENLRYFYERLPLLDEVSIGHALICDALYLGIDETLKRYLACLAFSH